MIKIGGRKPMRDTKYFEKIPQPQKLDLIDKRQVIMDNLQKRYKLKHEKDILKEQQIETRKRIYNLSLEISRIEDENDKLLFELGFN